MLLWWHIVKIVVRIVGVVVDVRDSGQRVATSIHVGRRRHG